MPSNFYFFLNPGREGYFQILLWCKECQMNTSNNQIQYTNNSTLAGLEYTRLQALHLSGRDMN